LSGFGAKAYSKLSLELDILNADPHRLVLILFDGALLAIQRAKGHLAQRRIAEKCQAIDQAIRIVDSGLCSSVDPTFAPAFSARLIGLYKYILRRLLQGNIRNDVEALDEAARLLGDLRAAWAKIGPAGTVAEGALGTNRPPGAQAVATPAEFARLAHAYRA